MYWQAHSLPARPPLVGKRRICCRWRFDEELGGVVRDRELVAGGHAVGDGSGAHNAVSWDDRIFRAEIV